MTPIPEWVWVHTTQVTPYEGESGHGRVHGEPSELDCLIDDTAQQVRTPSGKEITASTQVFYPLGTRIPVGSLITLPEPWSRTTTAIKVADRDSRGLNLPDHVHVFCE